LGVLLFGAGAVYSFMDLRWMSIARKKRIAAKPMTAGERGSLRFAAYLPLIFVVLEVVWIGFLLLAFIFLVGDKPFEMTAAKGRLFDVVAAAPAVAGLLLGVLGLAHRWANRKVDWVFLILGCAGCAVFVGGFVWGMFQ
jgi:hypothetical protein